MAHMHKQKTDKEKELIMQANYELRSQFLYCME